MKWLAWRIKQSDEIHMGNYLSMIFTRKGKIIWGTAKSEKPKETRDNLRNKDKTEIG